MKARLVRSHTERVRRIESGDLTVVGVNAFTDSADSPLTGDDRILRVDPAVEHELVADVVAWRAERPAGRRGARPSPSCAGSPTAGRT